MHNACPLKISYRARHSQIEKLTQQSKRRHVRGRCRRFERAYTNDQSFAGFSNKIGFKFLFFVSDNLNVLFTTAPQRRVLTLRCCGPLSARAHASSAAETVSTCSYRMVLQLIQTIYIKNGKTIL
jgi:hypothetical protein